MSSIEAAKATITAGITRTEDSGRAMELCFGEFNLTRAAIAGISRIADDTYTANTRIINSVTTASDQVTAAYAALKTELPSQSFGAPNLLATAATLNNAFNNLVLTRSDLVDPEAPTKALADVSRQKSAAAAEYADVAWAGAFDAAEHYHKASSDCEVAASADSYKNQIKKLRSQQLGKMAALCITIADMPDASTLLRASNYNIIGARLELEEIRDQTLVETSSPAILAQGVVDRLEGLIESLQGIIETQQPAQGQLVELRDTALEVEEIGRPARGDILEIRRQPARIIDQARALIASL